MALYHCEHAALPEGVRDRVLVEVEHQRVKSVRADVPAPADAYRLPGLTLPGFANAHSHAFHRALRGRTHGGRGDFWSWRKQMYGVAERIDPDTYLMLARATYAEMTLAGITAVGEFHYLHHQAGGREYEDPNEMGYALVQAATDAGIRLTLLDTCYLQAGPDGAPLSGPQLRFGDGNVKRWENRFQDLESTTACVVHEDDMRLGAAVHSVRACPPEAMSRVAAWARHLRAPLHFHLSEQRRENEECLAAHGRTPTQLAVDTGMLEATATAVHATHLTAADIETLGGKRTYACFCPTTERDLGDGIGPAKALTAAKARLCLGSDSHAQIDLLEEARAVEMHERLVAERRGVFRAKDLLKAATSAGYRSLGWSKGGALAAGMLADFATVGLYSVRLAGVPAGDELLAAVLFAGTAADVSHVVVGGQVVVADGEHQRVHNIDGMLRTAIERVS